MAIGTLYNRITPDEPLRTRVIVATHLIEHFKLDVNVSGPDDKYPSQFERKLVPSFQWADGTNLVESIPITLMLLDLVPNQGGLLGDGSSRTRAAIIQWMIFMNIDITLTLTPVFQMHAGKIPDDKVRYETQLKQLYANNAILERHLTKNKYLAGDKLTVADLYGAQSCLRGYQFIFDEAWTKKYPRVWAWWSEVSSHEIFNGYFKTLRPLAKFVPKF